MMPRCLPISTFQTAHSRSSPEFCHSSPLSLELSPSVKPRRRLSQRLPAPPPPPPAPAATSHFFSGCAARPISSPSRFNPSHAQFRSKAGNYLVCFWLDSAHKGADVSVSLDWRTGIAAKDWESVAKKEKIEGVELELKKLEGAVEAIHENLIYLKSREAEMRTVSEKTNSRVALFSLFSLGVCFTASVLQVVYLKHFFRKKKLI
ncbi:hypothetical protein Droror1_Dr00006035 [Drosera rotundifolia]